jgi:hypothetical protein
MPTTEQLAKELEQHYKVWWAESYPNAKPSPQAVSTAAAFAAYVLETTLPLFKTTISAEIESLTADPAKGREWLQQAGFTDADGRLLNKFRQEP